jgi:diguanylate cyclase (GGDEF)-like protein/PAS domain S-box-containing protein
MKNANGPGLGPLLSGAVASLVAALSVVVGHYATERRAWWAASALVVAVGVLAGVAVRQQLLRHARERERERLDLDAHLGALDVTMPAGDEAQDAQSRIEAVAAELRCLREIAEGVHGVEALFEASARLAWISPSIERLTGWTPAACLAAPDALALLVHESDRSYCLRMAQRVSEQGTGADFEMRLIREDGSVCWVACHWQPLGERSAHPSGLRLSAEDIQRRKETEYKLLETVTELRRAQALRERYLARSNDERQRLLALLNVIRLGILFMDRDHRVLYYNHAMLRIWDFPSDENLLGMRDVVLQSRVAGRVEEPKTYFEHVENVLHNHGVSEPYEIAMRDGRIITDVSAVVEAAQGRRWIGRVWLYEDVTEQRRIARQLVDLAERDPLTGLFNRRRFHEELDRLLADAARHDVQVGLVAIDLDAFKPINDEFGHQAGDEVLVGMTKEVGSVIRRNEMFFRLGGDEFAVLVADTGEAELCELARRLLDRIDGRRFEFGGRQVGVTASLGLATFPYHANCSERLIAAADRAMYESKNRGRNCWTLAGRTDESDRMSPLDSNEPNGKRE